MDEIEARLARLEAAIQQLAEQLLELQKEVARMQPAKFVI